MSNMGRGRPPKRIHRRVKSVHRDSTIKYGSQFRVAKRRKPTTGPKKVRKAGQVYRPVKDVAAGIHGASYGVYRQPATRERQQRFRNLTVKVAKTLGYPQSAAAGKIAKAVKQPGMAKNLKSARSSHSLGMWARQGKHYQTSSGFTDYEKLALAIAEGRDSDMVRLLGGKK